MALTVNTDDQPSNKGVEPQPSTPQPGAQPSVQKTTTTIQADKVEVNQNPSADGQNRIVKSVVARTPPKDPSKMDEQGNDPGKDVSGKNDVLPPEEAKRSDELSKEYTSQVAKQHVDANGAFKDGTFDGSHVTDKTVKKVLDDSAGATYEALIKETKVVTEEKPEEQPEKKA